MHTSLYKSEGHTMQVLNSIGQDLFTSFSMIFEIASLTLVIELAIILIVRLGWQFTAAEFIGGILMVIFIAVIFRLTLTPKPVQMAKAHAEKGIIGRMEGQAAMDMSISGCGS